MNQQQGTIFSKIAMPIVIVAIVVYLICSAWVGIRDPYQFTVAYTDTMETSVDAAGWVVRSEQPVAGAEVWSSSSGARERRWPRARRLPWSTRTRPMWRTRRSCSR